MIVDVVFENSVMWAEGWERGERGKSQRVGQLLPDRGPSGWEFTPISKKLALRVNRGSLLFLQGVQ
jgi:hypothetical protein